jgi:nucleotide-binding universal stress UspA family protein
MGDDVEDPGPTAPSPQRSGAAPRLVVGDDGSPSADVVWLWVNNHRWPGWRISVVSARLPDVGPPVGAERATLHRWEPEHPRQLFTDDEVEVEHLFAETDPRVALDSCADATLVAVGPRGRGLLKHLHIGSTTEWLIQAHRPLAPLVVVRSARATKDVLLCTDGSTHARSALETLVQLPWLTTCRVSVLGVNDRRNATDRAVEQAAARLREHGVGQVEHEVIEARHTRDGDVRSVILRFAEEHATDLLVVGARGTGGVRGLLLGLVTATVVHHASCSTLVARTA